MHLLQLNKRNDEVVVQHVISFWEKAMKTWLPVQYRLKVCKWISDFLLTKSYVCGNGKTRDFCITKLAEFVNDSPNVRLVAAWILKHNMKVMLPLLLRSPEPPEHEYPVESLVELGVTMTIHHQYYLCKSVCSSPFLTLEEKEEMMARVFKSDQSDSTIRFKEYSRARFPDAHTKLRNWKRITDLDSDCSFMAYKQHCDAFAGSPLHDALVLPYFDLYYEVLPQMMQSQFSPQKASVFMATCCPLLHRLDP